MLDADDVGGDVNVTVVPSASVVVVVVDPSLLVIDVVAFSASSSELELDPLPLGPSALFEPSKLAT